MIANAAQTHRLGTVAFDLAGFTFRAGEGGALSRVGTHFECIIHGREDEVSDEDGSFAMPPLEMWMRR